MMRLYRKKQKMMSQNRNSELQLNEEKTEEEPGNRMIESVRGKQSDLLNYVQICELIIIRGYINQIKIPQNTRIWSINMNRM